ncbi:hypothetical protein Bhyg_07043 [Pseudolycoriella hygida]|uniref:Uncharacterized protein n=1 Tax=Pseudolycoriella hygida TaxID=35572 RepID=A0A9Q0N1Z4_9DIPT|nr:hypothetical protein Bhyg_07043 [Pseudolycoriella hygida]
MTEKVLPFDFAALKVMKLIMRGSVTNDMHDQACQLDFKKLYNPFLDGATNRLIKQICLGVLLPCFLHDDFFSEWTLFMCSKKLALVMNEQLQITHSCSVSQSRPSISFAYFRNVRVDIKKVESLKSGILTFFDPRST